MTSTLQGFTHQLRDIRVIAGTLHVVLDKYSPNKGHQQWRNVSKIYSQKYFRFPAYSLTVLKLDREWDFNSHVNSIPYASLDQDFDGICSATAVRTMTSWKSSKVLFIEDMQVIPRASCESILQRTCKLYYCTAYAKADALAAAETEGGGLICHGTGDPQEVDDRGILVGVTTLINVNLPTLHNRIGLFRKWVDDSATTCGPDKRLLIYIIFFVLLFQ
ncbi:uncharacterized protein LOC126371604 [Pectinophora gossypiella]|uniref:uncharacterized protein LOC126371604 n=1 Tax=Pectinophora gossypiella TaxID=13191 RepID=UPI00214E66F3|nr:uncharacterized protein LOC126371604 [Pectinophora gossypiella]